MRADRQAPENGGSTSRGILAAALLCFLLATAVAFRLPVFFGGDERPHFGYVVKVLQGDLPELNDRLPSSDDRFPVLARSLGHKKAPWLDRGRSFFVANHPPLFYAVAAGPVWLASQSASDVVPPLTLRLMNAAFVSGGVLLTGWLALELFPGAPRRRFLGVMAASIAALTPTVVGVAPYGHNDGLAFALATGALLLTVRLMRQGPSVPLVVTAAVVGLAGALTRVSLLPLAVLLVVAITVGAARCGPPGRRARWAIVGSGAAAAVIAVGSAWFYLRNLDLYGTLTGDRYNLDRLDRLSRERSIWDVLSTGEFHELMWTRVYGSVHPALRFAGRGWLVAVLAGLVVVGLAARFLRGRSRRDVLGGGWVTVLLLGGFAVATAVGVADHVSQGGGMHPRYFLPIVPLVSALVARAVDALPGREAVGLAVVASLGWVTASLLLRYGDLVGLREDLDRVRLSGPAGSPVLTWLAVALAVVAFVRVVLAMLDPGPVARVQHHFHDGPTGWPISPVEPQGRRGMPASAAVVAARGPYS